MRGRAARGRIAAKLRGEDRAAPARFRTTLAEMETRLTPPPLQLLDAQAATTAALVFAVVKLATLGRHLPRMISSHNETARAALSAPLHPRAALPTVSSPHRACSAAARLEPAQLLPVTRPIPGALRFHRPAQRLVGAGARDRRRGPDSARLTPSRTPAAGSRVARAGTAEELRQAASKLSSIRPDSDRPPPRA